MICGQNSFHLRNNTNYIISTCLPINRRSVIYRRRHHNVYLEQREELLLNELPLRPTEGSSLRRDE